VDHGTNNRAELLGVWALLTVATRLHIHDLQVFRDSRIVIDWLNKRGKLQILNLHCWKERIKELVKGFRSLSFTHIFREFNQQEDTLSKRALDLQEGNIFYSQSVDGHLGPNLSLKLW
jgi:ribonuclease HI